MRSCSLVGDLNGCVDIEAIDKEVVYSYKCRLS